MTTRLFSSDGDAERHLRQSIRRQLLVRYFSDLFAEEEIIDQAIAEAFAAGEAFREWVMQQGINPDTLTARTSVGRALLRRCANAWSAKARTAQRDVKRQ